MSKALNFERLTVAKTKRLEPGMYVHEDTAYRGLKLNVGPHGHVWYFKGRVDGKVKSIRLGEFPGLSADEALAQIKTEKKHHGNATTADIRTLRDAWREYRVDALANARASEKHLDDMETKLERYAPGLMKMSPTQIALLDVRRCLNAIDGVATRHHVKAAINCCYAMLDIPTPIVRGKIKLAAVGERTTLWEQYCSATGHDEDDWSPMWEAIQGVGNAIRRTAWVVMLFTGIRSHDVRSLRWSQVDLERKEIRFEKLKSGVKRTLPISDTVVNALRAIRGNEEFVFRSFAQTGYIDHLDQLKHNGIPVLRQHDTRRHFQQACNEAMLPEQVTAFLRGDKTAGDSQMLLKYSRRVGKSAPAMIESVILERIRAVPDFVG